MMILALSVVVLLIIGMVIFAIWLAQTQATTIAAVRDILIIALALESCVFGAVIVLLFVMVIRMVNMLEFEIKPILEKTNETVNTLRGTTTFVSQNVVQPAIRTRAQLAGVRQAFKTLFGNPRNNIK
jgi:membrane protein implicated in regulation of membrane protease activity